jgi:hypothetical protein
MSQNHDYIPWKDEELLVFAENFYAYALANYTRWQVPSPQAYLEAPIAAYKIALTAYQDPNHGKIDTLNKNETKKALDSALRTYIQGFIARNPLVTDEDRERMGLPLRDTVPTPHPEPDVKPEIEALPSGKGKHTVTALNPQTGNKRKPPLVTGVAFAHRIREPEEKPATAEEMPSVYQTAAVKNFQWGEEVYGKAVDYACAYESEGGKRGPWSDVASLIIT